MGAVPKAPSGSGKDVTGSKLNKFTFMDQCVSLLLYGGVGCERLLKDEFITNVPVLLHSPEQLDYQFWKVMFTTIFSGGTSDNIKCDSGVVDTYKGIEPANLASYTARNGVKVKLNEVIIQHYKPNKKLDIVQQHLMRSVCVRSPFVTSYQCGALNIVNPSLDYLVIDFFPENYGNQEAIKNNPVGVKRSSRFRFVLGIDKGANDEGVIRAIGIYACCFNNLVEYCMRGTPFVKVEGRCVVPDSFSAYKISTEGNCNPFSVMKANGLTALARALLPHESRKQSFLTDPAFRSLKAKYSSSQDFNFALLVFLGGSDRNLLSASGAAIYTEILSEYNDFSKISTPPITEDEIKNILNALGEEEIVRLVDRVPSSASQDVIDAASFLTTLCSSAVPRLDVTKEVVTGNTLEVWTPDGTVVLDVPPRYIQFSVKSFGWIDSFRDFMIEASAPLGPKGVSANLSRYLGVTNYNPVLFPYADARKGDWISENDIEMLYSGATELHFDQATQKIQDVFCTSRIIDEREYFWPVVITLTDGTVVTFDWLNLKYQVKNLNNILANQASHIHEGDIDFVPSKLSKEERYERFSQQGSSSTISAKILNPTMGYLEEIIKKVEEVK